MLNNVKPHFFCKSVLNIHQLYLIIDEKAATCLWYLMENKWHSFCKLLKQCGIHLQKFHNLIDLQEACKQCFIIDQKEVLCISESKAGLEKSTKKLACL
jgi:hypothetical protein